VTICVELLNSKVDHKGYQAISTTFAHVAVGSPRVKLLRHLSHADHDVKTPIRTIRDNKIGLRTSTRACRAATN
jgi:hydroxypyruvate isomerase